jgi:SAM-dependent methyltransferase
MEQGQKSLYSPACETSIAAYESSYVSMGDDELTSLGNYPMIKRLAKLSELESQAWKHFMAELNQVAKRGGLDCYETFSRTWEYPWLWSQLEPLKGVGLEVLDIGSERSPLPWFLATQGFRVTVSDHTINSWSTWQNAKSQLRIPIRRRLLDAQQLNLPTATTDIYLSVSVIEHFHGKAQAVAEAARVLRPNGLLIMTFDVCEPELGMTFPEWNGSALTTREFDELFNNSGWFEPGLSTLPWNTEDIPAYLAWHCTTAPWHNYITGAAVVRRNHLPWKEPMWKDALRYTKGNARTAYRALRWNWEHRKSSASQKQ